MPSLLYPTVELGRRLAAAGPRLTFACPPEARRLIEHHDLEFVELDPGRYDRFLAADRRAGALSRLVNLRRRRDRALESLAVREFAREVRDSKPDLVLINGEMHEHVIAASSAAVPIALLNTFVSIWRRPGLPPPHHMVRPGIGWKGSRAGMALLWHMLRLRKRRRAAFHRVRDVGCDRLSVLARLARESGFDLGRETDASQWLIPFTYRRLPVLSLHALELEFPYHQPSWVHYVGPMVLESRIDRPMPKDERTRLDEIIERRRSGPGERRLIYAAFGSVFSSDLGLLKRLVGAVADRRDWDLLISLSDRVPAADLGPLPRGVHAFSWVPQLEVLRDADVMVNHGGINTVDECVTTSVPMLVYCGFETDMAGTTSRVVHHGIGIAGDRRSDDAPAIRGHIDRLLREKQFAENLGQLQRSCRMYAERRVAEDTVEALLERGDHDRPV
jgi:UDP:flavonoid glycosyltransferase YjiC (YdhE family)